MYGHSAAAYQARWSQDGCRAGSKALRRPSEADGSEGRALSDGGNAELTEDLDEYGLGELDRRGVQPSALEQESAETVLEW